jgi:hypothetical protein
MADDVVGSKLPQFASDAFKKPADNTKTGYGQNGYMGASSDTDLSNPTRSALSVELFPNAVADAKAAFDQAGLLDSGPGPFGKGDPPGPKVDHKKPGFGAPQTRKVSTDSYPLSFGMDKRTNRGA